MSPLPHRPKVPLKFEGTRFLVKTADNPQELAEVLRLRHEIFHREHHGRSLPSGLDVDDIDLVCDHLIIRDKERNRVIGCYRLTSTLFSDRFYAAHRFSLEGLFSLPGNKLELGRACVDRDYRNGTTLHLLWRGIGEYLRMTDSRYLFGSASIRTQDASQVAALWRFLRSGGHCELWKGIHPKTEAEVPGLAAELDRLADAPSSNAPENLPPLFGSYLKAGAKVRALPAQDRFMGSTDFLTVLTIDEMASRVGRRYTSGNSPYSSNVERSIHAAF